MIPWADEHMLPHCDWPRDSTRANTVHYTSFLELLLKQRGGEASFPGIASLRNVVPRLPQATLQRWSKGEASAEGT